MAEVPEAIRQSLAALPPSLLARSGSVFYSGKEAFSEHRDLYVAGLNPGGDPVRQRNETIEKHIGDFWKRTAPWSEYVDVSWEGAQPGAWGMQPQMRHMLHILGRDPRLTPSSNAIFVRSTNEGSLGSERDLLLQACWPVHQAVLDSLRVRVVVCLGKTAGALFRKKMDAHNPLDEIRERNARGWASTAHQAPDGRIVISVTHPSRASWINPASDPSPLVAEMLNMARPR
ncbi:uracil-DNA glycosylase family protein [Sphingomonas canadensis]|uniref:Uracil-DNA glycosylase family protein n=1 Tax=Sphingomonas canadensis TaxID=1219257 RepID=A0ABW3H149_9SPHN|nr:uracil-DNA glycosylase family protein [Sphingomonas canadensis]MCW3834942.1 uracil-DNA glycosylase family protein [Sphingomonas canadensis]